MTPPFETVPPRMPLRRAGLAALRRAAVLAGLLPLAGCLSDPGPVATAVVPADHHQRHPIVLADMPTTLDVFLVAGEAGLDDRQKHDVASFAADFRAEGRGRIRVLVPRGQVATRAVDATLLAVRRGLAAAGVKGAIEVGSYAVADPRLASALRLSFDKLQARVSTRCGEWPRSLGPDSTTQGWENRPYDNLGCATQQTFAAQVDDPRDLVRPRAEEPSDVQLRTRAIGKLRNGEDPTTKFEALKPIGGGN